MKPRVLFVSLFLFAFVLLRVDELRRRFRRNGGADSL